VVKYARGFFVINTLDPSIIFTNRCIADQFSVLNINKTTSIYHDDRLACVPISC
jgi:hypothetical protein